MIMFSPRKNFGMKISKYHPIFCELQNRQQGSSTQLEYGRSSRGVASRNMPDIKTNGKMVELNLIEFL